MAVRCRPGKRDARRWLPEFLEGSPTLPLAIHRGTENAATPQVAESTALGCALPGCVGLRTDCPGCAPGRAERRGEVRETRDRRRTASRIAASIAAIERQEATERSRAETATG